MRDLLIVAVLALLLSLTGCVSMFTAKTEATYLTPDGKQISYSSEKEHEGLDAKWTSTDAKGVKTEVHIKTVKSGTPEAAMAAVLQLYSRLQEALERLEPLIKGAAMGGS